MTKRKGPLARYLTILAAVLAMVAIVARMERRTDNLGARAAQAITQSAVTAHYADPDDAEDQSLAEDEAAAGEMWADHHKNVGSGACPDYSAAFWRGCTGGMY